MRRLPNEPPGRFHCPKSMPGPLSCTASSRSVGGLWCRRPAGWLALGAGGPQKCFLVLPAQRHHVPGHGGLLVAEGGHMLPIEGVGAVHPHQGFAAQAFEHLAQGQAQRVLALGGEDGGVSVIGFEQQNIGQEQAHKLTTYV